MTPKQQFLETFLKYVYGFDDVKFYMSYAGCTVAWGITRLATLPSSNLLLTLEDRIERTPVNVWVDKNKTTGYTVKFKTDPIPKAAFEKIKARAEYLCPGAAVDIYNRDHAYHRTADIPTLRLRVSELPWK